MFSPTSSGGHAMATRSRRRQRPLSSENLVQQPKAKRQRLPLTADTFVPPNSRDGTAELRHVDHAAEAKFDIGSKTDHGHHKSESLFMTRNNLSNLGGSSTLGVRSKKPKHVDKSNKGDGSVVLTSTGTFTVSRLPALPDRIRTESITDQYVEIDFASNYALSLTHTHAFVWPYTSNTPSPETFTFVLPYPSQHASDLAPVGCLVSPSAASTDPGLVVIMPMIGKLTYWESISSAATLDLIKHERHGVEYTIPGMFSGETVVQITNAETVGFILSFSSGRLAYMNVRDGHGRPSISVSFIRTSFTSNSGGLFGSIRHALTHSSSRGDIVAVRADRTNHIGECNVVALTMKGRLHAWKLHRGGHHDTVAIADVRESIITALQDLHAPARDYNSDSFEALDIVYVPKGLEPKYINLSRLSDAISSYDESLQHLMLLVSMTRKRTSLYALVEIVLAKSSCVVGMVRPLSSYSTPTGLATFSSVLKPHLYLPRPALVAFVIFDRAVVVASIAIPQQSPDSQLQQENHVVPDSYEDVIDLRDDAAVEIIGSGQEEPPPFDAGPDEIRHPRQKVRNPAVLLMVKGTGLLRLSITDIDRFASDDMAQVTAKSKLVQAVFFGAKADNPLLFDRCPRLEFSEREMADAALELSNEILSSSSPYMSSLPVSLEDNLHSRALALERLMVHLNTTLVYLDRRTRWCLLYNGEKMTLAAQLWKLHEKLTAARPLKDRASLVEQIISFIHESQKAIPNSAIGQTDRVRHWFLHDIARIDIFLAWTYEAFKYSNLEDRKTLPLLICEAIQINICVLSAAFEYRKTHLTLYGLENEDLDLGVLNTRHAGLLEPWTGMQRLVNSLKRLVELSNQTLEQSGLTKLQLDPAFDKKVVEAIANAMPVLLDLYLTCLLEASRWGASASDPGQKENAHKNARLYEAECDEKPCKLAKNLGMWNHAAAIAEKHRCWKGLARIKLDHIFCLEEETKDLALPRERSEKLAIQAQQLKENIGKLFDQYGEIFAFPMYDIWLKEGGPAAVFDFEFDRQKYKTEYLRSRPDLAKLSWINDIEVEDDMEHAAQTLLSLGLTEDRDLWNKKIELSLGKLALLAVAERAELAAESNQFSVTVSSEAQRLEQLVKVDRELRILAIQQQLFDHVRHTIRMAVDDTAKLPLAMEVHSCNITKKQKVLLQLFEDNMRRLINYSALDPLGLINLLSLISLNTEHREDLTDVFYLALVVADNIPKGDLKRLAIQLVWRRCLLRDDWSTINDTNQMDDTEVAERLSNTTLFSTLLTCYSRVDSLDGEKFKPLGPLELLDLDPNGLLERRFGESSKIVVDKFAASMKHEETTLRDNVEKYRLEAWFAATDDIAKRTVAEMADEATRIGAAHYAEEAGISAGSRTAAMDPF